MTDNERTRSRDLSRRDVLKLAGSAGLALSAGGVLAACGGDDAATTSAGKPADPKTISGSIVFTKGPFSDDDVRVIGDLLVRPFNASFPNVDVRTRMYDWGTRDTTLTTAFAGSNPPDVVYNSDSTWGRYASAGALVDLSDRILADDFRETYDAIPESLWESSKVDGKLWGVPVYTSMNGIATNVALMRAAGVKDWSSSWDALLEAARATARDGVHGWASPVSFPQFGQAYFLGMLFANGGTVLNAERTAGNLNTPEAIGAFQFFKDMFSSGAAARPGLYDSEAMVAKFLAGGIATIGETIGQTPQIARTIRDWRAFEIDQFPFPQGPLGSSAAVPASIGVLTIAAKSKNQDAAWEFIKYASSKQGVTDYLKYYNGAAQALRSDVPMSALHRDETALDRSDLEGVERSQPVVHIQEPVPQISDINRAICASLESVVSGKQTPEEAAKACDEAVTQALGA